jgi:toxin YoeB
VEIVLYPDAISDMKYWRKSGNKSIQKKITQLLHAIKENPFEGIGKPEPLKYDFTDKWSRHISQEHRIIYKVGGHIIKIYSLRGHYS